MARGYTLFVSAHGERSGLPELGSNRSACKNSAGEADPAGHRGDRGPSGLKREASNRKVFVQLDFH